MKKNENVKIITTDYNKKEFWKESEVEVKEADCMNVVNLYSECTRQEIKGFGGAFTEAAGFNYSKFDDKTKKDFIEAYFAEDGLKYNIGRTHINSCDFALSNYAAVTDETDKNFETFTLEREQKYILPLIHDAQEVCKGKIDFLLSPWSPPAFMKTNNEMNNGGKLKEEYFETWARYISKYIHEMKKEGIDVTYLTVQNEPEAVQTWDSCIYSAKEEMEFVRDYLGPVLKQDGLGDIKIFVWDHNKEIVFERAKAILEDKDASDYISGIAVHWYTGDHFEGLKLVKEIYPEKDIFFTEGCVEYSRFMDSGEIGKAEMYAHDMIGNFTNGLNAFFDWNLLLDHEGGPNHVKNFCAAPIMSKEDGKEFEKRLMYYYIGHFSRYIKKGAKNIATTKYCHEIETAAFVNPDGERILILLNRTKEELPVTVREDGMGFDLVLAGNSIVTVSIQ